MPFLFSNEPNEFTAAWSPEPVLGAQIDVSSKSVLVKIPASMLLVVGSYVQLAIQPPAGLGTINNFYIGNSATSGNAYDTAAAPTEFLRDTASGIVFADDGVPVYSDRLAFPVTKASSLRLGFNLAAATYASVGYAPGIITYVSTTSVAEADEAAPPATYDVYRDTIMFARMLGIAS